MIKNPSAKAFIAWTAIEGRSEEIAGALGAETRRYFWPPFTRTPLVPFRWLVSALRTAAFILRRRPSGVIVQNPPVIAALVAFAAARMVGAHLVIDAHPAALTRTGPRRWLPDRVNAGLARHVDAVMVTVWDLAERIGAHGGRGIVLHEAPPDIEPSEPPPAEERLRVLVVSRFAPDEPVGEVIEAAAGLPELDLVVTGERRLRPPGLAERAPGNVEFPGFLSIGEYRRALVESHVVMALTTRPYSVSRAAYDAVWALRPLVVSGGPQMAELFPHAVVVENTAASIAAGLRDAGARYSELARETSEARELARERWEQQLTELRDALSGGAWPRGGRAGAARPGARRGGGRRLRWPARRSGSGASGSPRPPCPRARSSRRGARPSARRPRWPGSARTSTTPRGRRAGSPTRPMSAAASRPPSTAGRRSSGDR